MYQFNKFITRASNTHTTALWIFTLFCLVLQVVNRWTVLLSHKLVTCFEKSHHQCLCAKPIRNPHKQWLVLSIHLFCEHICLSDIHHFLIGTRQVSSGLLHQPLLSCNSGIALTINTFLTCTQTDSLVRFDDGCTDGFLDNGLFARDVGTWKGENGMCKD